MKKIAKYSSLILIVFLFLQCRTTSSNNDNSIDSTPVVMDSLHTQDSKIGVGMSESSSEALGIKDSKYSLLDIPKKEVNWKEPGVKLSELEKSYLGSWVASVTDLSVRTGGVMISFGGEKKVNDLGGIVDAVIKNIDNVRREDCIWLELYSDHTGFYCGCMQVNGEPNVIESTDIMTGEKLPYGLMFNWYADSKGLKIQLEDNLSTIYTKNSLTGNVQVQYWNLNVLKRKIKDGNGYYSTKDYFPEYDFGYPIKNEYKHIPNYMYGGVGKYKKAIQ